MSILETPADEVAPSDTESEQLPFYHSDWDSASIENAISGIAWHLSRSPILYHLQRRDIEQELRLHLLSRIKYYRQSHGEHWSFFVQARLREGAAAIVNFYQRQVRCPPLPVCQLRFPVDDETSELERQTSLLEPADCRLPQSDVSKWEIQHDVSKVMESLQVDEQELCRCLMRMSVTATGRELGVPRSTVVDAAKRLRTRFEDAGLRDFLR